MLKYTEVLEVVCRSLPEVIAGVTFLVSRRRPDIKQARLLLDEIGLPESSIQDRGPLINDLTDFDRLVRSWESTSLMCILSYVVLAFVAPVLMVVSGVAIWVVVSVFVKLTIGGDSPESRYKSRRLLNWIIPCVLIVSAAGKVGTVLSNHDQPLSTPANRSSNPAKTEDGRTCFCS